MARIYVQVLHSTLFSFLLFLFLFLCSSFCSSHWQLFVGQSSPLIAAMLLLIGWYVLSTMVKSVLFTQTQHKIASITSIAIGKSTIRDQCSGCPQYQITQSAQQDHSQKGHKTTAVAGVVETTSRVTDTDEATRHASNKSCNTCTSHKSSTNKQINTPMTGRACRQKPVTLKLIFASHALPMSF